MSEGVKLKILVWNFSIIHIDPKTIRRKAPSVMIRNELIAGHLRIKITGEVFPINLLIPRFAQTFLSISFFVKVLSNVDGSGGVLTAHIRITPAAHEFHAELVIAVATDDVAQVVKLVINMVTRHEHHLIKRFGITRIIHSFIDVDLGIGIIPPDRLPG